MEQSLDGADDDSGPSYAELPMEIILHIFKYLNASDKKVVSTVCRRWYSAFIDPKFQSEFILKFCNIYLADNVQPAPTFLNCTDRPFLNVYLKKVELGLASSFFQHIGNDAEDLTIDSMDIIEHQLISILKEFRCLKRLSIKHCPEIFMCGQFLKSNADQIVLAKIFANLQSLSIQDNRYLTDAILFRIVSITPHLERLDLTGCLIAFHNALCRRFYPQNNTNEPSEAILTFQFVREIIEKYCATLTDLDLSQTLIGSAALESLATLKNTWHLQKISLRSCLQMTIAGLSNFVSSQPTIVHLDCSSTNLTAKNWASTLIEQLPGLQVLKLSNCKTLTDDDSEKLSILTCLKVLDISYCSALTNAGIMQGIAKSRNEILLELNLSGLNIGESCLIECSKNFPNLRSFQIAYCVTAVTDAVVQMIIQHLKWLRLLNLENCILITDTGLTGIQYTTEKPEQCLARNYLNNINSGTMGSMKISVRSRAEDEIVADANRKRALLAIIEEADTKIDDKRGFSIKQLKGLRLLNLSGCNKISDISLKHGLQFRELSTLSLSNCQQISFAGIQVLLQNCPSIENLHLSNCCNINDLTIELIAMKLKRLHLIDIRGCQQLTENHINNIHFHCKTLRV